MIKSAASRWFRPPDPIHENVGGRNLLDGGRLRAESEIGSGDGRCFHEKPGLTDGGNVLNNSVAQSGGGNSDQSGDCRKNRRGEDRVTRNHDEQKCNEQNESRQCGLMGVAQSSDSPGNCAQNEKCTDSTSDYSSI